MTTPHAHETSMPARKPDAPATRATDHGMMMAPSWPTASSIAEDGARVSLIAVARHRERRRAPSARGPILLRRPTTPRMSGVRAALMASRAERRDRRRDGEEHELRHASEDERHQHPATGERTPVEAEHGRRRRRRHRSQRIGPYPPRHDRFGAKVDDEHHGQGQHPGIPQGRTADATRRLNGRVRLRRPLQQLEHPDAATRDGQRNQSPVYLRVRADPTERQRDRDRARGTEHAEHIQHGPAPVAVDGGDERVRGCVHTGPAEAHDERPERRVPEPGREREQENGRRHQQRPRAEHACAARFGRRCGPPPR